LGGACGKCQRPWSSPQVFHRDVPGSSCQPCLRPQHSSPDRQPDHAGDSNHRGNQPEVVRFGPFPAAAGTVVEAGSRLEQGLVLAAPLSPGEMRRRWWSRHWQFLLDQTGGPAATAPGRGSFVQQRRRREGRSGPPRQVVSGRQRACATAGIRHTLSSVLQARSVGLQPRASPKGCSTHWFLSGPQYKRASSRIPFGLPIVLPKAGVVKIGMVGKVNRGLVKAGEV